MADSTISAALLDATDEYSPGPSLVFTSASNGYAFFVVSGASNGLVYSKTTNGGTTWGTPVVIDSSGKTWGTVGIWFDKWTPSDTGTLIHIVGLETTTDDLWYTYLDTSSDTLRGGGVVAAILGSDYAPVPDGPCVITKDTSGNLYAAAIWGAANVPRQGLNMAISNTAGASWANTIDTLTTEYVDDDDCCMLAPLTGGGVVLVMHDFTGNNLYWHRWNGSAWSAQTTLCAHTGDATYKASWALTGLPDVSAHSANGAVDLYAGVLSTVGAGTGSLQCYAFNRTANSNAGVWTQKTNVATNAANPSQLLGPALSINTARGALVCYYLIGTINATTDPLAKISLDWGATWSSASPFLDTNSGIDDYKSVRSTWANAFQTAVVWYDDDDNDLFFSTLDWGKLTGYTKNNAGTAVGNVAVMGVRVANTTFPYTNTAIDCQSISNTTSTGYYQIVSWSPANNYLILGINPSGNTTGVTAEFLIANTTN